MLYGLLIFLDFQTSIHRMGKNIFLKKNYGITTKQIINTPKTELLIYYISLYSTMRIISGCIIRFSIGTEKPMSRLISIMYV